MWLVENCGDSAPAGARGMSKEEMVTYLLGTGAVSIGTTLLGGFGAGLIVLGFLFISLAIIGDWDTPKHTQS